MDDTRIRDVVGPAPQTAEWLRAEGRERGFCPYEATKRLIAGADVVVAPYVFALDSGLRRRLLDWWGCAEKDVVLVVDEAHNLPEYLRSMGSPRLTRDRLRRGLTEAKDLGDPEVLRGVGVQGFLEALALLLDRIVLEYSKEEDGFVPPFELEAHLMERYTTTSRSLVEAARAMQQLGEILKDRRRAAGKIPRSALGHVGSFLEQWFESDEAGYVKIAGREPQPYLEAFLVDTARLGELFQGFHATLHASGTLDPLEEYRDSLGLPESSRLERFPSHFPPNRLLVRAVAGMTTRYETLRENPRAVSNLQDALRAILERVRLNAACFFPSHRMMQDFREVGVFDGLGGTTWFEDRGMGQAGLMDLVARHRAESGRSLLVGVVGGRLSEGMDFPGRQLEVAVIVGVPYPKPTAHQRAVFHYHESRSDRGWEYAVRAPAVRRLRQALGRLVRSGDDRGFAIVLDERAAPLLSASGLTAPLSLPNDVLTELEAWQNEPVRATSLSETPQ